MAQIPFQNFAFTDPVAAQQAVQMGQLLTLAQAEKDRNLANYAQETLRQKTAQQNAARQQAIQQGQLNQQMAEANLNRQARATETDKILSSQEKVAGMNLSGKNENKAINDKFENLASLVESQDPPTDSEFNSIASGLPSDRMMVLRNALVSKRRELGALAGEAQNLADYWNSQFKVVPGSPEHLRVKQSFAKDRRAQELIYQDPRTMEFMPKYKGPRTDPLPTSEAPGVTSIDELRRRIGSGGTGIVTPMPAPGFTPQPTDFAVPQPQPAPAPFQVPIPLGY